MIERIGSHSAARALHGIDKTRELERAAAARLPAFELMRRAGLSVARLAITLAPHARRIVVMVGPGNNGGDGLEAAAWLARWGKEVTACLLGDPVDLPADASSAFAHAREAGVAIVLVPADPTGRAWPEGAELAIDALLGIGASRAPFGAMAAAIQRLDAWGRGGCQVLAVDVPSGLGVDTGQALGEDCVTARHTLSLLTLKPGLFTAAGRDHAGQVWFDALDREGDPSTPDAWLVGVDPTRSKPRSHARNKGSFGDVAVIGGAPGMTGAALLCARAAQAAGAGRVYVDLLDDRTNALDHDVLHPELMFRRGWWQASPPGTVAAATIVCGCGGGDAVRAALPRLLSLATRLVLDADALNAIACDESLQAALRARALRPVATVLTPHPLEAARLICTTTRRVQDDRLRSCHELVEKFGCVVVLKGSGSIVAAPGLVPSINATGNASLATAGTGDVLAGWIGGSWAQASTHLDAESVASMVGSAVARHGAAAEPQRPGAMRASDLVESLYVDLRSPR